MKDILKKDWIKREGNIYKDWSFYPFSIQYIWEDEAWDWSVYYVNFLYVDQEFLEEDIEEFFKVDVYEVIDYFLSEKEKEKQALNVRFYKNDLDFIKTYAKMHGLAYQSLIRDFTHKWVEELKNA